MSQNNIKIPQDVHTFLKIRAAEERMSLQDYIEKVLRAAIKSKMKKVSAETHPADDMVAEAKTN